MNLFTRQLLTMLAASLFATSALSAPITYTAQAWVYGIDEWQDEEPLPQEGASDYGSGVLISMGDYLTINWTFDRQALISSQPRKHVYQGGANRVLVTSANGSVVYDSNSLPTYTTQFETSSRGNNPDSLYLSSWGQRPDGVGFSFALILRNADGVYQPNWNPRDSGRGRGELDLYWINRDDMRELAIPTAIVSIDRVSPAQVPEPSTFGLILLAAGGLVAARSRQASK